MWVFLVYFLCFMSLGVIFSILLCMFLKYIYLYVSLDLLLCFAPLGHCFFAKWHVWKYYSQYTILTITAPLHKVAKQS